MSEIGLFLDAEVLPALFSSLDRAFPEFDWRRRGRGWQAGPACEAGILAAVGTDTPGKISCLEKGKQGFYCAKTGEHTLWVAYVHGGVGSGVPNGADYAAAVRELAERAGVDAAHLDGATVDPAERAKRRAEAEAAIATARAEAEEKQRREDEDAVAFAMCVYAEGEAGHPAIAAYFEGRGLEVPTEALHSLRFGVMAPNDPTTAILCPVRRADGSFCGLQRIAVNAAGVPIRDADGQKIKKMLGRPAGGAVRIGKFRPDRLWLVEGVETAMAVHQATGEMVLATLSATGLERIDLGNLGSAWKFVIAGDLDRSKRGQEAAYALERRLLDEGRTVCVRLPNAASLPELVAATPEGDMPRGDAKSVDWLDVVVAGRGDLLRAPMSFGRETPADGGGGDETTSDDAGDDAPRELLWRGQTRRARLAAHRIWGWPTGERDARRWRIAFWSRFEHWYEWDGRKWSRISPALVFARLADFFDGFDIKVKKPVENEQGAMVEQQYAGLSSGEIENIIKQMRACAMVTDRELPCWAPPTYAGGRPVFEQQAQERMRPADTGPDAFPEPGKLLSTESGILRLDAWDEGRVELLDHTPLFFSTHAVPHELNADALRAQIESDPEDESMGSELWAPMAPKFAKLLDAICEEDLDKRACLLEWLGYCLTVDQDHELALLLTGQPGSGKGSFCAAIEAMLGRDMVAATSFTALAGKHHTSTLMGKMVAVMADAHVDDRDSSAAVETAKSIVSGDPVTIDEKWGAQDDAALRLKLVVCCNELPKFRDPSGSWAQRLLVVPMPRGNRRNPDRSIKSGIRHEGQGILLAALFGRRRLMRQGTFTRPQDGVDLLREYEMMNAPVQEFVHDCCRVGEGLEVRSGLLYELYCDWAEHKGLGRLSMPKFHEHLRNAIPMYVKGERQRGGERARTVRGLAPLTADHFMGEWVDRRCDCVRFEFDDDQAAGEVGGISYD